MSGLQNKNLMFYSTHPNDKLSKMCLAELEKMPELKKQFIPICIHDPHDISKPALIRLPPIVDQCKNRGLIPILAIAGFEKPIFATSALSWIKESSLKLDEGIAPSNIHGGGVADNCSTISGAASAGNTLFDTDYNIGFSNAKGEFNKGYANIDEAAESRIVTYDEVNDKQTASNEISQRLEQLKFNRDVEGPKAPQRAGGGMPQMGGMPQQGQGGYGMPQQGQGGYGMPQMPQQGQGGYGMPQMPQQGQGGYGMPQMPQQGQGGGQAHSRQGQSSSSRHRHR
jgi:hypothetical protein